MNSITAYGKSDPQGNTLMTFLPGHAQAEPRRRSAWLAEAAAYLLAIAAHGGLWLAYQAMPVPEPPKEEPLIIEASLVVAQPAPAAAPEPPKPQVQPPPPRPKPIPKPEKPAPKKPDKPKPVPKPRPVPQPTPQAEAPPAPEPVEEAPPAPVAAPRHAEKPAAEPAEDTRYHTGGVSGFSRRYPHLAQERGWEGTVTLKVHILADGDIGEVIVIGSSGHDILDEQAVELIKEAHATPARRGDKPVDSWVVVPYQFKLKH